MRGKHLVLESETSEFFFARSILYKIGAGMFPTRIDRCGYNRTLLAFMCDSGTLLQIVETTTGMFLFCLIILEDRLPVED